MRKWLGFILLLGLMACPSKAGAQNPIKFETVNVELRSEFDKPSMLVITEFVVSQDTPVPATVTIRFPKEGNLTAVAVNQNGRLFNANFEGPDEQGNWQTLKIDVQSRDIYHVEYYQPLTRDGNKREFKYQWFGEYAVDNLSINMQIPSDSANIVTSPALSGTSLSPDGISILGLVTKSGLSAKQSYEFKVEYTRESDAITNSENSVQPSEPIGPDTSGRVSVDKVPYVIGGIGAALIVIALFFYWRSTQSGESTPRRRRRQHSEEAGESQAYCHECGARAHAGDRFCRTCGSRLRTGQ